MNIDLDAQYKKKTGKNWNCSSDNVLNVKWLNHEKETDTVDFHEIYHVRLKHISSQKGFKTTTHYFNGNTSTVVS